MYDENLKQAALELLHALDHNHEAVDDKMVSLADAIAQDEMVIKTALEEMAKEHDAYLVH